MPTIMAYIINSLCLIMLMQIAAASELKDVFPNCQQNHNQEANTGTTGTLSRAVKRFGRQIEIDSTTELVSTITSTLSTGLTESTITAEDDTDLAPTTTTLMTTTISDETSNSSEVKLTAQETLDAFIAGPLIVVGAISLVSLCLFLLYVCKYRSTGSSALSEVA